MFFVRHGERLDQVKNGKHGPINYDTFDPPLSAAGMQQAHDAGSKIKNHIKLKGFSDAPIKFISSPFLRTL